MKAQSPMLVLMMALAAAGCEGTKRASSPEIRGHVIEATSRQPIEGVIVYALWEAEVEPRSFTGGFSRSACYHAEVNTTDAQGQFVLQPWHDELRFAIKEPDVAIRAYKLGYRVVSSDPTAAGVSISLTQLPADADERLQELRKHIQYCSDATSSSRKKLFTLLRALYYDARGIATTPAQLEQVAQLREAAATVGSESRPDDTNEIRHERQQRFMKEQLQ